ncbi:MAG: FKBP-type peptidyl-prolyl cis-trans isomerase [Bacteroidales bacterium]|nr:FKBP-type peptidyl-prolyl cis-trans isomerase [Bacteroidales bacterium]
MEQEKKGTEPNMNKAWIFAFVLAALVAGGYFVKNYLDNQTTYESPVATESADAVNDSIRAAGEAFMAKVEQDPDVKPLGGGVFYKELKAGTGAKPGQDSEVRVNYEGRLIDGTVFDSSYERGQEASFPVSGVIQGWQIALKAMPVGSTWEVYIPQYYGYGSQGSGPKIPPYSALVFKVELLGIK